MSAVALLPSLSRFGMFDPWVLVWEAFVSLSLMGYGFGALRILRVRDEALTVAVCAGVAVWILLGGWLNLAGWASRGVLVGLLGVGFLLCGWELGHHEMRARLMARLRAMVAQRGLMLMAAPVCVYFLLVFAAHLRPVGWNKFDDPQAYMAYAEKASALGSLQSDPYSERRVNTGMGGGIFLDVTMLAGADDSTMGYIDGAYGYLAYILAVWAVGKAMGLSNKRAVMLLYAIPLVTLAKVNLTIVNLSTAFFLVILLLLLQVDWKIGMSRGVGILMGVVLGAACTLKSSNIPFGGLLVIFCAVGLAFQARNWKRLLPFVYAAEQVGLVAVPWMLLLHREQGTYLFPSLGRGFHVSAYGMLPLPAQTATPMQSLLIAAPMLAMVVGAGLFAGLMLRNRAMELEVPLVGFFGASLVSVVLMAISLAGESIDRFSMPMVAPCLLLVAAAALLVWRTAGRTMPLVLTSGFLAVCVCFLYSALRQRENLYNDVDQIRTLAGDNGRMKRYFTDLDPGTIERNAAEVRRAQAAVPAGEPILEDTETAYGYDWERNDVLVADYPGMAGPRPGPPVMGDAEAMRQYLVGAGVRYVILDRRLYIPLDFEEFRSQPRLVVKPEEWKRVLLRDEPVTPWSRMEYYVEHNTRKQLLEIAASRPPLYDDGRLEVISLDMDLSSTVGPAGR